MKRKVHRIARSLAELLSLLEGVQAVLLGEAADIEVFDPYFTIDIDVYVAGAPPSLEARRTQIGRAHV
jgi:N-acyl-D-aspartate/D-glutamate deacylase